MGEIEPDDTSKDCCLWTSQRSTCLWVCVMWVTIAFLFRTAALDNSSGASTHIRVHGNGSPWSSTVHLLEPYMIALIYRVSQKISSGFFFFFARCSGKTRMNFLVNPIAYAFVYLDWKSLFSTSPLSKSSNAPLGSLLPPFSLLSPFYIEKEKIEKQKKPSSTGREISY